MKMRFPKAPPGPVTVGSRFADSDARAKLSPVAPSDTLHQPRARARGGTQGVTASLRGWQRAQPRAGHPQGLAGDGEVVIETASRGKEGQGRQRALPVPAHGKAPLSAPLIIGSSFSLPGPPRRRGGPAKEALCLLLFQPFSRKLPPKIGGGGLKIRGGGGEAVCGG